MKRFLLLLLAPGVLLGDDPAEVFPPQGVAPDRYDAMACRSPFVLPTQEETAVEAGWASDFQIVSLLKSGDEYVVFAKKISTDERMVIRSRENAHGLRLLKLQMSNNPREVSALIALGEAEGSIEYDPALLSTAPAPAPADHPALKSE